VRSDETIYVAGGRTLVGGAILRQLSRRGLTRLVGLGEDEPDPADPGQVIPFFAAHRPAYVFVAAGRSGGIAANRGVPADLMLHNLRVAATLVPAAHRYGTRKLLYLASSCIYPRECPQPMRPESLLAGPLEPTNEAYALAKLAGVTLCQAYATQYGARFVAAIPASPFGPGDDFTAEGSHVIPALLARMHQAREAGRGAVEVWGTGAPRREFLFADDLAEACLTVMERYQETAPINLGGGETLSIRALAELVAEVVGYRGVIRFDPSRPDGMPEKRLDPTALLALGWRPATPLRGALAATYAWYLENVARVRTQTWLSREPVRAQFFEAGMSNIEY
jgi:GDP-L-fucose synthase